MNRIEVLLEALKECNRHIETLDASYTEKEREEFRMMAYEIAKAILAEKDDSGSVTQRTERDGSNIEDAGSIPARGALLFDFCF